MISINQFNKNIIDILNIGSIESIKIFNNDLIRDVVLDKNLNEILFKKFKNNYECIYGDDIDNFYMKTQDLLYRLNLLINNIIIDKLNISNEKEIYNVVYSYVTNDSVCLYDAVNYDNTDLQELNDSVVLESEKLSIL